MLGNARQIEKMNGPPSRGRSLHEGLVEREKKISSVGVKGRGFRAIMRKKRHALYKRRVLEYWGHKM